MKKIQECVSCFAILAGLSVALLLGVDPAEAQTVISQTTRLTADPVCVPGGVCVDIVASDIHLVGNNHVVDCGGSGTGVRIANQTMVHLRDLEVRNCDVGILIVGGGDHQIDGVNVHDNVAAAGDGDGIRLENTAKNTFKRCRSVSNDAFGVRLVASHNNFFLFCEVTGNSGPPHCGGYLLTNSNGNTIANNDISRNGDVGVEILNSSVNSVHDNLVNDTNFFGTRTTAIAVIGDSDGNRFHENQTNNNENGISLGCPTGCTFTSGPTVGADENHIIKANIANDNFSNAAPSLGDGIQVGDGNTNNRIWGNTALNNHRWDLFDGNPACDANNWNNNTFTTTNNPACVK